MSRHRWLRGLLMTVLALTLLVSAVTAGAAAPRVSAGTALPPAGQYPMTITDYEGRQVTIPAVPRRIITLAPSNTEILFALSLGDRVVGADTYSDFPEAAKDLPRIGDLMNPNFEAVVAAQPDLVLTIGGTRKLWEKLEEIGIPVVVLQPLNLQQVMEAIQLVGRITGADEDAAATVGAMQYQLKNIQSKLSYTDYRPRVFWEIWNDPLMTAGPGSFMDDLIRLAGGTNLAADAPGPWPEVSVEAIIAADPEVILTPDPVWAAKLLNGELPAWNQTTAVRLRNVYVVDDNLTSRPGPRMIYGLEQVASSLHPLLFWIWSGY